MTKDQICIRLDEVHLDIIDPLQPFYGNSGVGFLPGMNSEISTTLRPGGYNEPRALLFYRPHGCSSGYELR